MMKRPTVWLWIDITMVNRIANAQLRNFSWPRDSQPLTVWFMSLSLMNRNHHDFRKSDSLHLTVFDPVLTLQWSFMTIKTNDLTRQWIDDNCKKSLPRGYYFKMQIEQKFSYHDSSNSYPLEVTEIAVRSDSLFRSISLNYPNCGYYMVIMKSVNIIILLWKIV